MQNNILAVYTQTKNAINTTNNLHKQNFKFDYKINDKQVAILLLITYQDHNELGYSYLNKNNINYNFYSSINSFTLKLEARANIQHKDAGNNLIINYLTSLFSGSTTLAKSFIDNKNVNNVNIKYHKIAIESPVIKSLIGDIKSKIISRTSDIYVKNTKEYLGFNNKAIFSFISNSSEMNNNDDYSSTFLKETSFFNLPYSLRVKETDSYINNHLTNLNIFHTNTKNNLIKYSDSIKLNERIEINDTLNTNTITYCKTIGKFKDIIYSQPKPCKRYIELLEEAKSVKISTVFNKDYYIFIRILENITRDSKGELSPLYFNFVLAQLVKFIKEPTVKLKPYERGFVMFEGVQNSGKSTFLNIIKSLFDENVLFTSNKQLKLLDSESMNLDQDSFKLARFVVLEESLEFNNVNKEMLKEFAFKNFVVFPRKYKTPLKVDVNYTTFCAYNKDIDEVRGDIFLENSSSNRRFVFCNSSVELSSYFNLINQQQELISTVEATEPHYITLEDIDNIMNNKKALVNIINGLLQEENSEYNFNQLDNIDLDKKDKVKKAKHTTQGLLLDKLELMNDDIMGFLKSFNIPQRTFSYIETNIENNILNLPLTIFNNYCWDNKKAPISRRKAKELITPLLKDLDNIRIINNKNVVYFRIKIKIDNKNNTFQP